MGIRQGCCLSPYLFILAAEVLAIQIREDPNIRGIEIEGKEFKLSLFADDLTGFARDRASMLKMIDHIQDFQAQSGLKINKQKSKIMPAVGGSVSDSHLRDIEVCDAFQTLGVWFSNNPTQSFNYERNFELIIDKMKACCSSWSSHSLSLKGKVTVVNTLITSRIQYMCSSIHTPKRVLEEVRSQITQFVWNSHRSKIAYSTLVKPI